VAGLESGTVFDLLDYLTSNILLPLGGLAIALFAGWVIPDRMLIEELGLSPTGGRILRAILRYVAPAAIAATAFSAVFLSRCAPMTDLADADGESYGRLRGLCRQPTIERTAVSARSKLN
jgi:hypothetical protein